MEIKWPKRIARVLALPETTEDEKRSKYSKLTLTALRLYPASPMQNQISAEYRRIQGEMKA